jgi:hypothetical protein
MTARATVRPPKPESNRPIGPVMSAVEFTSQRLREIGPVHGENSASARPALQHIPSRRLRRYRYAPSDDRTATVGSSTHALDALRRQTTLPHTRCGGPPAAGVYVVRPSRCNRDNYLTGVWQRFSRTDPKGPTPTLPSRKDVPRTTRHASTAQPPRSIFQNVLGRMSSGE